MTRETRGHVAGRVNLTREFFHPSRVFDLHIRPADGHFKTCVILICVHLSDAWPGCSGYYIDVDTSMHIWRHFLIASKIQKENGHERGLPAESGKV